MYSCVDIEILILFEINLVNNKVMDKLGSLNVDLCKRFLIFCIFYKTMI